MRWWTGVCVAAGVAVLTACGASASGGAAEPSGPSGAAGNCAAGHAQVTVAPGDPAVRSLCVRPGTVVALMLRPRIDDKRWTAVHTSAPALALPSGWRLDPDGTAHASLRCAAARSGAARVTALAKAPDIAGAPRVAFTLDVRVVPYAREG